MINVKDIVYSAIKDVCENVSDSFFPEEIEDDEYPVIIYLEEQNNVYDFTSEGEATSYIRYKFDIWDKASTTDTSVEIGNIMAVLGFKRIHCEDIPEVGIKHKLMRFEALIDDDKECIYFRE